MNNAEKLQAQVNKPSWAEQVDIESPDLPILSHATIREEETVSANQVPASTPTHTHMLLAPLTIMSLILRTVITHFHHKVWNHQLSHIQSISLWTHSFGFLYLEQMSIWKET